MGFQVGDKSPQRFLIHLKGSLPARGSPSAVILQKLSFMRRLFVVFMGQQGYFVAYGNDQVVILQAGYALFDISNPDILFILTCLAVLRLYLPVDRIEVQFCKDKLGAIRGVSGLLAISFMMKMSSRDASLITRWPKNLIFVALCHMASDRLKLYEILSANMSKFRPPSRPAGLRPAAHAFSPGRRSESPDSGRSKQPLLVLLAPADDIDILGGVLSPAPASPLRL